MQCTLCNVDVYWRCTIFLYAVGFWGDGHYWHWPQYPIYEPGGAGLLLHLFHQLQSILWHQHSTVSITCHWIKSPSLSGSICIILVKICWSKYSTIPFVTFQAFKVPISATDLISENRSLWEQFSCWAISAAMLLQAGTFTLPPPTGRNANAIIVMSSGRPTLRCTVGCKCDYVMRIGFPCSCIGNYRFPILLCCRTLCMCYVAPHQSLGLWARIWSYCHNLSSSISASNARSWCAISNNPRYMLL